MKRNSDIGAFFAVTIGVALPLWVIGAWVTHLIVCFKTASWGFLVAGAIFFPVAVVHGTGVWMGAW